jgi:type IX secretion system substrate protein
MYKLITHTAFKLCIVFLISIQSIAQHGSSPVGVNWIMVTFDDPPSTVTVEKAPLKYNKNFALSMQIDDADLSLYTHGFPVFEGGEVNGTPYVGYSYTDGCGNYHSFKMSSSVYVFANDNLNGPDIHIDNSNGQLSWDQMDTIYNNEWGILNHGVNSNESPDPSFIDYSISRNESYIRRQLYNVTNGGVIPHLFVNPNGNTNWTVPAFNKGYTSALNQNSLFPIGNNGGDVNNLAVDWTQQYNINRKIAENILVSSFVNGLADSSINGANYWCPIFTHSLIENYLFNDFVNDFNSIASTYGANGLDNILMTSDEEILNYLHVRDATTINYVLNGTTLLITFSGTIPDNLLYYSSSIVVNSDAVINNIVVDGTDDYSHNGIGKTDALVNVNWDGNTVIAPEHLADSMVTIATNTLNRFDCWIAMDYVITLTNGSHKDSLRKVLCDIQNVDYDEGFCDCEINIQPSDTTINNNDCIDLFGAVGEYTYEWFIGDSLVDTTQDIYTCPIDTTQYNHIATNSFGCPAEDSIVVNINFLTIDLGPDTTICENDCVTISGPPDMIVYNWFVADTLYDTLQSIEACPIDTTMYTLWVENDLGANAQDSIIVNVKTSPTVEFEADSLLGCFGNNIELSVTASSDVELFLWLYNGEDSITQTNTYTLIDVQDSANVYIGVTSANECAAYDSVYLSILPFPEITTSNDTTICPGDSIKLSVLGGSHFLWVVEEDTISHDSVITVAPLVATNYIAFTAFDDSLCYAYDTVVIQIFDSARTAILFDTNLYCSYETVELTASGAEHYSWHPGDDTTTLYSFIITDTTTIWLIGTTEDGCKLIDSAKFFNKPAPIVSFTGLLPVFCENDASVTLSGSPPNGNFTGNGIVGDNFHPQSAGGGEHEIVYSFTNTEGCTGTDTTVTTVYGNEGTIDLGSDFTLQINESKTLDAGAGFDSYFWTTGETNQSITVIGSDKPAGTYEYAVMGVIHGCSTRGSVFVTFEGPDGINENHIKNLSIYPNPNDGYFTITFSTTENDIELRLINIHNQVVFEKNKLQCAEDCSVAINIAGTKPGFYILQVTTSKGISTAKIVLK